MLQPRGAQTALLRPAARAAWWVELAGVPRGRMVMAAAGAGLLVLAAAAGVALSVEAATSSSGGSGVPVVETTAEATTDATAEATVATTPGPDAPPGLIIASRAPAPGDAAPSLPVPPAAAPVVVVQRDSGSPGSVDDQGPEMSRPGEVVSSSHPATAQVRPAAPPQDPGWRPAAPPIVNADRPVAPPVAVESTADTGPALPEGPTEEPTTPDLGAGYATDTLE